MKLIRLMLCCAAALSASAQNGPPASAPATLLFVSPIFGDNMVLQRGKPNSIWGWSEPGDSVRVESGENTATGTTGANGKWQVRIQPPAPGGPYTVKISGRQTSELHNVLVGDVWIAAGQSNMQFGLAPEEVRNANFPQIRYFVVGQRGAYTQADVPRGSWKVVSPENVGGRGGGISAVACFFARRVQRDMSIPIGLVQEAVGGVPAETFTSPEGLRPLKVFDAGLDGVERHVRNKDPEYGNSISHWYDDYDTGMKNGQNWADPQLDTASWKTVQVPGRFQELGIADIPSLSWFRTEITLPETLPAGAARLYLGWRKWTPPSSTDAR